jgi:hypothetical protein
MPSRKDRLGIYIFRSKNAYRIKILTWIDCVKLQSSFGLMFRAEILFEQPKIVTKSIKPPFGRKTLINWNAQHSVRLKSFLEFSKENRKQIVNVQKASKTYAKSGKSFRKVA